MIAMRLMATLACACLTACQAEPTVESEVGEIDAAGQLAEPAFDKAREAEIEKDAKTIAEAADQAVAIKEAEIAAENRSTDSALQSEAAAPE